MIQYDKTNDYTKLIHRGAMDLGNLCCGRPPDQRLLPGVMYTQKKCTEKRRLVSFSQQSTHA
jgi:hypothetical protein